MSQKRAQCPLSSPSIGIISESDHRNRLCICPLCTCKEHICPSTLSTEPYPKSMYSSQYNSNFTVHKFSKPLLCQTPNKAKSSQPVNFETTNEEFYRPVHSPASLVMPGFTRSPLPEAKFMGKTSYGSNFMNWGSGGVYYVTEQHIKHTSQEMQLHGKSSYQDNYVKIQDEELLKPRRLGKEVARLQKHLGLRISNAKIMKESVSKKDFQDYSKKALTTREKRDYQTIPVVKSINSHYLTMAQTDYIAHPMQVDHRNLRKQHERNKKLL